MQHFFNPLFGYKKSVHVSCLAINVDVVALENHKQIHLETHAELSE